MPNHAKRIRQATKAQKALANKATQGQWRQQYHFTAPGGWLNDPNGCIYYGGRYHLFYQHNPYDAVWGAMHWGHATSKDLVHWQHQPVALAPSEPYDDHPGGGVFSGSAVNNGGELALLYTATTDRRKGPVQTQCLATSRDEGLTFEKYAGNPVIPRRPKGVSRDFRDPRAFRYKGHWYMVLGAALGKGAKEGGEGAALLYRSDNLKQWEYRGIIARSQGRMGTMWECPDLFPLGDKWVLAFSPMYYGNRKSVYLVGGMDFSSARFTAQYEGELDWGCEYYAAQSLRDPTGRTVLMAWQNGWDWMPWWKDFGPTAAEGWCGSMALPRSVALDRENRIVSAPVRELETLRRAPWKAMRRQVGETPLALPCADPVHFEMKLVFDLEKTTARKLHLDLRAAGDHRTRVTLNLEAGELLVDRSRADEGRSAGVRRCRLLREGATLDLRVFSDTASIELFTDGGLTCMSQTVYPTHEGQGCYLTAEGGTAALAQAQTWQMAPAKDA